MRRHPKTGFDRTARPHRHCLVTVKWPAAGPQRVQIIKKPEPPTALETYAERLAGNADASNGLMLDIQAWTSCRGH